MQKILNKQTQQPNFVSHKQFSELKVVHCITHLQALQIPMKFLLQVASYIRRKLWKFWTQRLSV